MVYLIGGSSHVGKTLLAQKLMERLKIPYLSLDHLKMGFIRTGMTELTVNDDYKMRYWMWPFVAELIKTVCENDQSLIIEGCYIPSEWRESFSPEYLAKIRCVFIVMSENYLRTNFDSVAGKASVIEHRIDDRPDLSKRAWSTGCRTGRSSTPCSTCCPTRNRASSTARSSSSAC